MPRPESGSRTQNAVLLEANGIDNDGRTTYAAATIVIVRYAKKIREAGDGTSDPQTGQGEVIVGDYIPVGSLLWIGDYADFDIDNPGTLLRVVAYNEVPDIKGRYYHRTVTIERVETKITLTG